MDTAAALRDLHSLDYFIWDDFLNSAEVATVVMDYQTIYERGSFHVARTGKIPVPRNSDVLIRTDETYWLNPIDLTSSQALFWNRLELLKLEINEKFLLGLWSLDGHYSKYEINGSYRRHLDRFKDDDLRTISMILYFNSEWCVGDGGELRMHFPGKQPDTLDIAPLGGRLVCFLSSIVQHEVLVAHKTRRSFAGWWNRRAIERQD
jgi:SM-20-related protein